jgi:uncharacterized membrane protein YebE (DUF533 family)
MFDAKRLLGQVLGEALGGNLGGSHRRKKSRDPLAMMGIGKAQVGLGLLGVAFAAYEHYKGGAAASPVMGQAMPPTPPSAMPPPPPPPMARPAAPAIDNDRALHLLRAMIAAANADGAIDSTERAGVLDRARAAGLDQDDLATLDVEMRAPMTLAQIAARTPAGLQEETWVAAFVAAMPDTQEEQRFLAGLGDALGFDAAARMAIAHRHGLA